MDEQFYKAKVKQVRGGLGLALAGAWIVFWWLKFDAEKAAAKAGCQGEGFFGGISKSLCSNGAEGAWGGQIFLVVLVSPLAFWIAHYLAKWWVDQQVNAEAMRRAQAEQARQDAHQRSLQQIGDQAAEEANASRRDNDRHELITRLGAVDDQLIVLENETDPNRITRIKMSISQALREIDAKFTDQELQALIAAHASIRQRVERTLSEMQRLQLKATRQYEDLAGMFGFGGTTEEERALAAESSPCFDEQPAANQA